ncbi:MAG: biopolymer transporter ExbD [Methylovulum sp.]|jgi:biopolymer transport protein ExbD|nr:biopolymer transporter ExbD [Methylovulum sp.]MCF7997679.1 biopolymer transporter ExbD [Methylovulum sp.]
MKFHRKRRVTPEISMTSMVDVVLLLLFFFMVSTTFSRQTEIKIQLPEADATLTEEPPDSVTLSIDVDGVYYLQRNDELPHELINQQLDTLIQALRKSATDPAQIPVIINADSNTPHQAVMKALDAAAHAGYSRISFGALKPDNKKP